MTATDQTLIVVGTGVGMALASALTFSVAILIGRWIDRRKALKVGHE